MPKVVKPGEIFKQGDPRIKDVRTYKCHSKDMVELIEPSEYQKNMDKAFRSKKAEWHQNSVSLIEEMWYTQRGFVVEEPEGKLRCILAVRESQQEHGVAFMLRKASPKCSSRKATKPLRS